MKKTIILADSIIELSKEAYLLNEKAKQHNNLSHYIPDISVFENIFVDRTIKATNARVLLDKSEENAIGKRNADEVFISCFTHNENYDERMMERFGNNHKGMRLTFYFKTDFLENFINTDLPIIGFCEKQKTYEFSYLNLESDLLNEKQKEKVPLFRNDIFAELILTDIDYGVDKLKDESVLIIDGKKDLVLNWATKRIKEEYRFQEETRISTILRATSNKTLDYIEYLLIPIHFKNLIQIEITFGKNASQTTKDEVQQICENEHLTDKISIKHQ